MALPATFPQAPKRPPATQAFLAANGTMSQAWLNYFEALDRWNAAVRVRLDAI